MEKTEVYIDIAKEAIKTLRARGADKAQCLLRVSDIDEVTAEASKFNLMRTMTTVEVILRAISRKRASTVSVNRLDRDALTKAADRCMDALTYAEEDEYADIAELTENGRFSRGRLSGDPEIMTRRLVEYAGDIAREYPDIVYECGGTYERRCSVLTNSNGVEYSDETGGYRIFGGFTAVRDGQVTSFGPGSYVILLDPDTRYIELGDARAELQRAMNLLNPAPVGKKFSGTLLASPTFVAQFFSYLQRIALSDGPVTAKTSRFQNSLGTSVADKRITWSYAPFAKDIVLGERFTPDGYLAEDFDVIRDGVLESFTLTRHGARKSGLPRAKNSGGSLCIATGETPVADIIGGIDRGIIIGRYSGVEPGTDGEISGVAKNGFLIEGGRVVSPIVETMISANVFDMLESVRAVSVEARRNGGFVVPYLAFDGVTIR